MKLPDGWESFYQDVCNKAKTLSSCNIWSISPSAALAWLGNFEKDEHRYIAAHILDRVIFRTEKMVEGSYKSFIASTFRRYAKDCHPIQHNTILDWFNILRSHPKGEHNNIKICPVSKSGDNGDSGNLMVRLLTGELFHQNRVISLQATPLNTLDGELILIVDDFVGSGEQFIDFAEEACLAEASKVNNIIYAPAIGYYKGLEEITRRNLGISLLPLETIKENERFFSHKPGAMFCGDNINKEIDVVECYKAMRELNPLFKKGAWLGRNNESLNVIFQWGCPNQSLGVMWYDGGPRWERLARKRGGQ